MAEGSFGFAGFRVHASVEVPPAVARAIRRVGRIGRGSGQVRAAGAGGRLVVLTPPPATYDRHPSDAGAAFIRDRSSRRAEAAAAGKGPDDPTAQPWYHTIELPGGGETQGQFDHRPLLSLYGIPEDLTGKKVLDVATADGFWAFELERRGAEVTALDIASTDDVDLPPAVRDLVTEQGLVDPLGAGFDLAHRLRGSKVTKVVGTVYDADPAQLGRFDLVHSGDLLLHLRDPLKALQRMRSLTAAGGTLLLSDVFDPDIGWPRRPGRKLARYLGGYVSAGWWYPAFDTLVQMVFDAGCSEVETVAVYNLAPRWDQAGPWRAVLRGRP